MASIVNKEACHLSVHMESNHNQPCVADAKYSLVTSVAC